jgi:hypothetical protein
MRQETLIIKLYDNENYPYNMIELRLGYLKDFEELLYDYRLRNVGSYCYDDFIDLLKKQDYFIREIKHDVSIFF